MAKNYKGSLIDFRKKKQPLSGSGSRRNRSSKTFVVDYRGYYVVDHEGKFITV